MPVLTTMPILHRKQLARDTLLLHYPTTIAL